ncbi:ABC transporter ATP-binding protein [Tessaracoccus caeni]|uniref:ABC transporter ATP-binding protein n=1 Tax=Tessaracoccus caeni TaxID=3031239 RepID=UPI0023DCE90D|nr:ABC transporter ATP-binding protein [Tessaracoccus caeni]MDF1487526.1 ABC transporter ATP-binding protein [Tessaracoccus caeni]
MSEAATRSKMTVLGEALTSAGYSVKQAAVWTPGWLAISVLLELLIALNPAVQVQLVAQLVRAVDGGGEGVWLPLILLSAFVGLFLITGRLSGMIGEQFSISLAREYQKQLLWAITELPPQRLATEEVNANVQGCRGALWDVSMNVRSAISAVTAIIGAAALCLSVWTINPLAGILVVVAVLPTIVASSWTAIAEDRQWPLIGEFERKKGYYQEQLVFARTGTELATLGSGVRMARLTDDAQVERNRLFGRLLRTYMISGVLAGAVTAALIAGALGSIALGGGGGAGVAAGTLGVISGVAAIQGAAYSYGALMTEAPKVTRFREFIGSIEPHEPSVVVPVVHELRATGLQVTYPTKAVPALTGFSFSVRRGETIAFVGVNGAGKTTAVNALLGIVDADHGEIAIDGRDVAGMTRFERLGYFGLLTQEFGRYELTVRESVALGTPDLDVSDERIWAALDAARSGDLVRSFPDGLDTQLGTQWGGTGLSGGQWQRIALARIYLRGAGIWLLDEPTSAIDAEAEQEIFSQLRQSAADRITIVVSHRAWTLRGMDRIYVFDEGRVIEEGRYEELLAAGGRFAEIFKEQAG